MEEGGTQARGGGKTSLSTLGSLPKKGVNANKSRYRILMIMMLNSNSFANSSTTVKGTVQHPRTVSFLPLTMDWSSEVHYPSDPSTSTTTASSSRAVLTSAYPQQPRLHLDTDAAVRPAAHDPSEDTARPSNAHVHRQFHSAPLANDDEEEEGQEQFAESPEAIGMDIAGLARPLMQSERDSLAHLDRLKFFLATAPSHWASNNANSTVVSATNPHPALHRFLLPSQEYVSCVLWGNLYHITGTDIVRALVFRFEAFGRPVRNMKKFEEGVFSDLRNLKPGIDACLEEPKVRSFIHSLRFVESTS